jgi:hypothetical protein
VKTHATGYRSVLLCAAMLMAALPGSADTIKLKNGSVIKGKVTTFNDQEFTVMLDLGTSSRRSTSRMVISVEDVASIEFDGSGGESAAGRVLSSPSVAETPVERAPARETYTPASNTAEPPRETATPASSSPAGSFAAEPTAVLAEKSVKVIAAADWTSTEIRVRRGQRVSVAASGEVDLGGNRMSGPDGHKASDPRKLLTDKPTGGLIAVVGDNNDDFVYVGRENEFTAAHDGILFLSVNEGNLKDNNGSFTARVKVYGKK